MLKDYVSICNKKINMYFIYCEFEIQFDSNYTKHVKTGFVHIIESEKYIILLYIFLIVLN